MLERLRQRIGRWSAAYREVGGGWVGARMLATYAALRLWSVLMNCFPIEANLHTARIIGKVGWLIDRLFLGRYYERRSLEQLRPSLGDVYSERALRRIARRAFEHVAMVYLAELVCTPRAINLWNWARCVELHDLGPPLRRLLAQRGAIMLTAHFGNFELLGYTLATLGLPISAIMRPLDNPLLNEFVKQRRQAAGLTLLSKHGVTSEADDVLAARGTLCFIADQDAGRKQVFAEFFGRKASWYKSIGILAMRHRVPIIVGNAVRVGGGFRYRIAVERIIEPADWDAQDDPLAWITQTYAADLERAIRRAPEQYLWLHRRWKTRPRHELAAGATSGAQAGLGRGTA